MLENQIDQAERRAVMRNEQRVREEQRRVFAPDQSEPKQATTMHQFAQADAETPRGRFSAVGAAYVVGSTAIPQYPAASGPFQRDPVPDEPPLGDNPALELASPAQATGEPLSASPLGGSPLSSQPTAFKRRI
jgi:hypothetical protein